MVALCFATACAIGALAAGSAFAEAPEIGRCVAKAGGKFQDAGCTKASIPGKEKFEWMPGAVKTKFTTTIKEATVATLETKLGAKVICKGQSATGEITGLKTIALSPVTFTGCESGGFPCSTEGSASGEVVTVPLVGELGIEKIGTKGPVTNKIGNELSPATGEEFVHFTCAGVTIKVRGHVISPVTSNKMLLTATVKFAATKGKQKPESFVGGEKQILESSFAGGPFEQSGQTITTLQTTEEKLEISSVN